MGVFCLGAGFANNKIAFLVLRALQGISSALTIPSALNHIIRLFSTDAQAQAGAIGVFTCAAALGNSVCLRPHAQH